MKKKETDALLPKKEMQRNNSLVRYINSSIQCNNMQKKQMAY